MNQADLNLPSSLPTAIGMPRLNRDRHLDQRAIPEERAVALVYDGTTAAVVMATPADFTDLAIGFSLTEGIIKAASEIDDLNVVPSADGIELRMWLKPGCGAKFKDRQRRLVGPTGCGLCGIESLSEAVRQSPSLVRKISVGSHQIELALEALSGAQALNRTTRATHAAGFYSPTAGLVVTREDVGRHNALDKLAGAMAVTHLSGGDGAIILTSRVSVEMVQKTAAIGSSILIAISAPTALAVRTAHTCGITLVAIARGNQFEIFSHPEGITCD
ncbi:MAG: formate dehydrogenase accessory sulfurtransferase FdhD [Candidatus Dormibacteraeota bacterium]|nr:formate dehydrogenase accessory sulfurtransferase FdhD [Candidatus Dormibacteraeota bacterium]